MSSASSRAVYLFQRNIGGADNWGEAIKLQAADGAEDDAFGHAVAISGHRLWCGAPYDDDVTASSGAAYRFDLQAVLPEADLSIAVDDGSTSAVPGATTTRSCGRRTSFSSMASNRGTRARGRKPSILECVA